MDTKHHDDRLRKLLKERLSELPLEEARARALWERIEKSVPSPSVARVKIYGVAATVLLAALLFSLVGPTHFTPGSHTGFPTGQENTKELFSEPRLPTLDFGFNDLDTTTAVSWEVEEKIDGETFDKRFSATELTVFGESAAAKIKCTTMISTLSARKPILFEHGIARPDSLSPISLSPGPKELFRNRYFYSKSAVSYHSFTPSIKAS